MIDAKKKLVRYIDLIYFKKKLDEYLDKRLSEYIKIDKDKSLSTNDFNNEYKAFLDKLINNSDGEYISEDEISDMFDDDPKNHLEVKQLRGLFTVEK